MPADLAAIYRFSLRCLMLPVARFCVRRSLTIQTLLEEAKAAFIEAAAEEMEQNGEKVNVSRLSAITGMHRRDVMRIYREGVKHEYAGSIASRVLGQWEQDERFLSRGRKPRVLTLEGEQSEFKTLVRSVSKDLNPGTVLFDLQRLQAVEIGPRGVKMKRQEHLIEQDPGESFKLLGRDVDDLTNSVEQNVFSPAEQRNLHARTEYDNISLNDLPEIRRWLLKQGADFHAKARSYLARFDQDVNPEPGKTGGARVVIGTFSRTSGGADGEDD